MSTQEILAQIPNLPAEERGRLVEALQTLAAAEQATEAPSPAAQILPQADMHPGAWEVADDFDDPLPDEFWLGGNP